MEEREKTKPIASYRDLKVYQITYNAAVFLVRELLNRLPSSEKYDLVDQLRRSAKAIPRLIAEGYGKRHQRMGFQKYLSDAIAECNETVVGLCQCRDMYDIDCADLIEKYESAGRMLYRLHQAWRSFPEKQNPAS
jgi:four helix bundle protein